MDWEKWVPIEAERFDRRGGAYGSTLEVTLTADPPSDWQGFFLHGPTHGPIVLYQLSLSGRVASALTEEDDASIMKVRQAFLDRISAANADFQRNYLPQLRANQKRERERREADERREAELRDKLNKK